MAANEVQGTTRVCSKCKQTGHNARSCKQVTEVGQDNQDSHPTLLPEDISFPRLFADSLESRKRQFDDSDAVESSGDAQHPVKRRYLNKVRYDPGRVVGRHTPCHIPSFKIVNGEKVAIDNRRSCAYCRRRCHFICFQCNVGLHIGESLEDNCFYRFHSEN